MNRERIGLAARACQLGQQKKARRLAAFERLVPLLRWGLVLGWLWRIPCWRPTGDWIMLLSVSGSVYVLSLALSACERLIRNRWMHALRQRRPRAVVDVLTEFSRYDVLLAVRMAVFYRVHLLLRAALLLFLPGVLTVAAAWLVFDCGVSRSMFYGGAVCLLLMWIAALVFLFAAREPLQTAVSLLIDRQSFVQRKNSLVRLDQDCFRLAKFSFLWLSLPEGARFQAKALYALMGQ